MLHPSYTDLMEAVNEESVENSEGPVVQSRYSIVLATAKRARQIVAGSKPQVKGIKTNKPLSIAVDEIYNKKVRILSDEEAAEEEITTAVIDSDEITGDEDVDFSVAAESVEE